MRQYSALRLPGQHQPVTMPDFGDRIGIDRATPTRALRPLQRDGGPRGRLSRVIVETA